MKARRIHRWAIVAAIGVTGLGISAPTGAQFFSHTASGSGTDGIGNRLSILAFDNGFLGGTGIAFVRPRFESGPNTLVFLTCVIFDERFGPEFHFVYTNGVSLDGRRFYLGVFDDFGPGRTGPTDDIYVQQTPVAGPCNVAAESSYPIGWDPVSSGSYTVN